MDLFLYGNGTNNRTLAGYFSTCSYNQVTLLPQNVQVLGPVTVPCKGKLSNSSAFSTGPRFTSDACNSTDNMQKWHYWLDEWADINYGVHAADFHHRVLILPPYFSVDVAGR